MKRKAPNPAKSAKRLKIISAVLWALTSLGGVGILTVLARGLAEMGQGDWGILAGLWIFATFGTPTVNVTSILALLALASGARARKAEQKAIAAEADAGPCPLEPRNAGRRLLKAGLLTAGPIAFAFALKTFLVSAMLGEEWYVALAYAGFIDLLIILIAGIIFLIAGIISLIGALRVSPFLPRAPIAS